MNRAFSLEGAKVSVELFFKAHMLPIGMTVGALAYVIYHALSGLHFLGPFLLPAVKFIQPALLFVMLFLTFCKVEPSQLRPHRWQWWLVGVQVLSFVALAYLLVVVRRNGADIFWTTAIEGAMLCLICPTATAAAVVTGKLGGDVAGIITYTVLINLFVAILVPAVVPLIHPVAGVSFIVAFRMILSQVFPLLICPCLLAWLVRYLMPALHRRILRYPDLAFYVWAIALPMAIMMTTRAIYHSNAPLAVLGGIAAASLLACAFQFWLGHILGARFDAIKNKPLELSRPKFTNGPVTVGQSLGQKNTVFAIWMGYTFMSPIVSIAGGFYCIWHNVYNSWQLNRKG